MVLPGVPRVAGHRREGRGLCPGRQDVKNVARAITRYLHAVAFFFFFSAGARRPRGRRSCPSRDHLSNFALEFGELPRRWGGPSVGNEGTREMDGLLVLFGFMTK